MLSSKVNCERVGAQRKQTPSWWYYRRLEADIEIRGRGAEGGDRSIYVAISHAAN
jgi:hypothetical protein